MGERFASASDYEKCRRIHRQFGTTYYFATLRFPKRIRRRVHAVYAFVRVPDEWVDNPGELSEQARLDLIEDWRAQLHAGLEGVRPQHFAMRAFVDTVRECLIPLSEAELFLDAMAMDVWKTRYATYDELRDYMRGSAAAVGVMMCYAMESKASEATLARACALGEAMQLTNFLRDVSEDVDRGRIYLPQEVLEAHGVTEADVISKRFTPAFRELMRHEVCRARMLYAHADWGLAELPPRMRRAVLVARILYAKILDVLAAQDFNIFAGRARTSKATKLRCAFQVVLRGDAILADLLCLPKGSHRSGLNLATHPLE